MPLPARNSLAVIGAGPVGLEAASAALDRGFDVHLFERGAVGASLLGWGHVNLFTPWRMNLGRSSAERLRQSGWKTPEGEITPTAAEMVEHYLAPLAALPELRERVHTNAQVVWISRRGLLKSDMMGQPRRRDYPFRLLVRDSGGRESFLHAFAVIDASGVYGQPNWAGDGGIPARGELYLAPQLSYQVDDVLDLRRLRYAGKRVLVVGGGASAASAVVDLAQLAVRSPGTSVLWVTRRPAAELYKPIARDPLIGRQLLFEQARELLRGSNNAVKHAGGVVVESIEFNSATHKYRVTVRGAGNPTGVEAMRIEEADQVLVNTGFGPDNSIYRELQVHECYASRGSMNLSAALLGAGASDGLTTPSFGVDALEHPEPDFFIVGHKILRPLAALPARDRLPAGHRRARQAGPTIGARHRRELERTTAMAERNGCGRDALFTSCCMCVGWGPPPLRRAHPSPGRSAANGGSTTAGRRDLPGRCPRSTSDFEVARPARSTVRSAARGLAARAGESASKPIHPKASTQAGLNLRSFSERRSSALTGAPICLSTTTVRSSSG